MASEDPSVKKVDPSVKKEVAHYERLFVKHLDECASWRCSDNPEPFLLHARKALEAAVYAEHLRMVGQRPSGKSLDDVLKALVSRGMSAQVRAFCEVIRTQTNPAAHVVEPTETMTTKNVEVVAQTLPEATKWFSERMDRSQGDLRELVANCIADIEGKKRQPPDAKQEGEFATLRAELEESREQNRRRIERPRGPPAGSPSGALSLRVAIAALLGATGGAGLALVVFSAGGLRPVSSQPISPGGALVCRFSA